MTPMITISRASRAILLRENAASVAYIRLRPKNRFCSVLGVVRSPVPRGVVWHGLSQNEMLQIVCIPSPVTVLFDEAH
jgi:hypothetical protein